MDVEKILREVRIVVGTVLLGVMAAKVAIIPDFTLTVDKVNSLVDKSNKLVDSVHRAGHKVMLDYDDPAHPYDGFYYNIQNDLFNSQQTSKHLDDLVLATNENLNGAKGVFANVNQLLGTASTLLSDLTKDINTLSTTANETLLPLKDSLKNVDTLTKELADELASGGNIDQTVVKLNKSLDDVDKLLSDPNIAATISNGQNITKSLASSAQTVDEVLLPYRQKVGQLKFVLGKIIDLVKVTIKVW